MTFSYGGLHMDTPVLADQQKIHWLSADTGWCLDGLPRTMDYRDGWWERVKGIHAVGMPLWWWLIKMIYTVIWYQVFLFNTRLDLGVMAMKGWFYTHKSLRKDLLFNCYCYRKWTWWCEFESWTRLFEFHTVLIPLGKV